MAGVSGASGQLPCTLDSTIEPSPAFLRGADRTGRPLVNGGASGRPVVCLCLGACRMGLAGTLAPPLCRMLAVRDMIRACSSPSPHIANAADAPSDSWLTAGRIAMVATGRWGCAIGARRPRRSTRRHGPLPIRGLPRKWLRESSGAQSARWTITAVLTLPFAR